MSSSSTDSSTDRLIVRGARVIDPAQNIDRTTDIAISEGKITAIGDDIDNWSQAEAAVIDANGLIASPGWIDLHAHVFIGVNGNGVHPDEDAGIATGVTTVVDTGSAGAETWPMFRDNVLQTATTRVLAFLNVSLQPQEGPWHGEWSNFSQKKTIELAEQDAEAGYCLGIKVLASQTHCGNLGITPVKLARQAARLSGTGLMVHIGNAPPVVQDVLNLLEAGDIVTHCWHGKYGGLLDRNKKPIPEAWAAAERGVKFDIGHGSASFSLHTARYALDAGLPLHSISTDLHRGCINGPVYDMPTTMTKFLHLGLDLREVIRLSTWSPAQLMHRDDEIGTLQVGRDADMTIFRVVDEEFQVMDSEGHTETASQRLDVMYTIRNGAVAKTPANHA